MLTPIRPSGVTVTRNVRSVVCSECSYPSAHPICPGRVESDGGEHTAGACRRTHSARDVPMQARLTAWRLRGVSAAMPRRSSRWRRAACLRLMDSDSGGPGAWRARGGVPIITNPPWKRDQLHALIGHFTRCAPFRWLLFDANWAHTRQPKTSTKTAPASSRSGVCAGSRVHLTLARTTPAGIGSNKRTRSGRFCSRFGATTERTKLARAKSAAHHIRCCARIRGSAPMPVANARDRIAVTVTVTEDARLDGPQLPSSFFDPRYT